MSSPTNAIAELLRVELRSDGGYTADLADFWGAPSGADVWTRIALAAACSCPGVLLVSLQGALPDGLALGTPLSLRIEPSDGPQGVCRCHVEIVQGARRGHALATFTGGGEGPDYQDVSPSEAPPDPASLPSTLETARAEGWPEEYVRGPVEFRRIGPMWRDPERGESFHHLAWLAPRSPVPEGPGMAAAALVLAASWYPHWEFERRIGPGFAQAGFRVLDQSVRIHQTEPWRDAWLLEARSERSHAGRALSTRRLFARDERLLASTSASALVTTQGEIA